MNKEDITIHILAFCLDELDMLDTMQEALIRDDKREVVQMINDMREANRIMFERMKKEHKAAVAEMEEG
jgi:hypothetical protein